MQHATACTCLSTGPPACSRAGLLQGIAKGCLHGQAWTGLQLLAQKTDTSFGLHTLYPTMRCTAAVPLAGGGDGTGLPGGEHSAKQAE